MAWIWYFSFLCNTYRRNVLRLLYNTFEWIPASKWGGTNFSKYFTCMNSGFILSNIFSLKLYYSNPLYSRLKRNTHWYKLLRWVAPGSFITRPSRRLVWYIYKASPSANKMSGTYNFKHLPWPHNPFRISFNLAAEVIEEINGWLGGFYWLNSPLQILHKQLLLGPKHWRRSMVRSRSSVKGPG